MESGIPILVAIITAMGAIFQGWGKHIAKKGNDKLLKEKNDLQMEADSLRQEIDKVKSNLWNEKVCSVMLDGLRKAGKTTFLAKLVNPTIEGVPSSTFVRYDTPPIPICWSRKNRQPLICSLKVYDTAGEDDAGVVNTFLKMNEDLGKEDKCVLVLFWDITKDAENEEKLSSSRLKGVYNNDLGLARISHIIVFINKVDAARAQMSESQIEEKAKEIHRYLSSNLSKHGQISLYYGSALTGEGVHACYGEMLHQFGLADSLPSLSGSFPKTTMSA